MMNNTDIKQCQYDIKHHKDLHKVQLQGLKIKERAIFMALCFKAMNQSDTLLKFDVNEISKISNYRPTEKGDNIFKYLRETYKSLKNITIQIDKEHGYKDFVLFTMIETFEDKNTVHLQVNKEFKYILNQVVAPYTIQNLLEYRTLSSKYSQLMYSILKEWEGQQKLRIAIDDFKEKLGVPKKNFHMCDIDKRVLKPIIEELSKFFKNLTIEKIKEGRKITALIFTWGIGSNTIEEVKNKSAAIRKKRHDHAKEKESQKNNELALEAFNCANEKNKICLEQNNKKAVCEVCKRIGGATYQTSLV